MSITGKLRYFAVIIIVLLLGVASVPSSFAITANNVWDEDGSLTYRIFGEEMIYNTSDTSKQDKYQVNYNYDNQLVIKYTKEENAKMLFDITIENFTNFLWFSNSENLSSDPVTGLADGNLFTGIFTNPSYFSGYSPGSEIEDFTVSFDHRGKSQSFVPINEGESEFEISHLPEIPTFRFSLNDSLDFSYYHVAQHSGVMIQLQGSSEYLNSTTGLKYDLDYTVILMEYSGVDIFDFSDPIIGTIISLSGLAIILIVIIILVRHPPSIFKADSNIDYIDQETDSDDYEMN